MVAMGTLLRTIGPDSVSRGSSNWMCPGIDGSAGGRVPSADSVLIGAPVGNRGVAFLP